MIEKRHLPFAVGLLLGVLQTGLFFQLTFTLSSGFGTYLLITLCWLSGGALGSAFAARIPLTLYLLQVIMLAAYALCGLGVLAFPFNTQLVPLYAVLIGAAGVYPGVFFARMGARLSARMLFFWENNGFIVGLVVCTFAFMFGGRLVLWLLPAVLAVVVWVWTGKENTTLVVVE